VASIPSVIAAWKAPFPNPIDLEEDEQGTAAEAAAVAATAAPSTTAPVS